jgi:hypothetical protein
MAPLMMKAGYPDSFFVMCFSILYIMSEEVLSKRGEMLRLRLEGLKA